MAKTKISEFSSTPGNNTDIDGINIAEGCAPSGINDAIRELMAQLKDWQSGTSGDSFTVGNGGVISLPAGSASAPAITRTGDTNTGIFFPAADTIAFTEGGTESARFDSSGNLGIGTTSPGQKLTIQGPSNQAFLLAQDSTAAFQAIYGSDSAVGGAVLGSLSNHPVIFRTNNTERMRIDTSGNLGLGVTPSAWGGGIKALQLVGGRAALASDGTTSTWLSNNWFNDGTDKYVATGAVTIYRQASGAHQWFNAPSGTAGNAISFTQAMTLDASGRLGLGQTSIPSGVLFDLKEPTAGNDLIVGLSAGTGARAQLRSIAFADANSSALSFHTTSGGSTAERARIDSSGQFMVNRTSSYTNAFVQAENISGVRTAYAARAQGTAAATLFEFWNPNGQVGSIQTSGSATSYVTSSDYRLKKDVQPMTGALAKVAALKPVTYKWKADGSDGQGFIAHELQEVCPDAVVGEKDAVDAEGNPQYQGIDTSFLIATLTAALQEAVAEINQLKARLDAANL